jgi:multidrug efflux pump subunit AcrB
MERNANKTEGLVSFILGIISIFYMSPVFVPLAILLGIVALFKKQFVWGVLGILCAIVGLITSPILLTALGLTVIALETHSFRHDNKPRHPIQRPATEIKVPSPKIRLIHVPFTPTSLL